MGLIVLILLGALVIYAWPQLQSTVTPGGQSIGTCAPETGHTVIVSTKNPLDDENDRIATTAYLVQFEGSDGYLLDSNLTLASKPTDFSTQVACGKSYGVIAGTAGVAGTGRYYEVIGPYNGDSYSTSYNMQVTPVGTVDPSVRTETNSTYGDDTVLTIGSGETASFILRLKENTADAAYGQDGYVGICISYPTVNVSEVKVVGGEALGYTPDVVSISAGYTADCWKVKADLKDYSVWEGTVQVVAKSGRNPAIGDVLTITVMDWASYIMNDEVHYGFTSNTGAAIHGADDTGSTVSLH